MRILFAGGGTGGHFYPIIAVARALRKIADEKRILDLEMIFMSDTPFDVGLLNREDIKFKRTPAGKIRRYFSLLNITDTAKTAIGIVKAVWDIFLNIPDVIFAKGGYASFPALIAGRLFKIPVIIHESDSVPGKVNMWARKFARRIAISFPETIEYFKEEPKIALTGTPIRTQILGGNPDEAYTQFKLSTELPVIFVLGGSQGAQTINNAILDILPELLKKYQVIHQCGKKNYDEIQKRSDLILENSEFLNRYRLFAFLNEAELRNASSIADLILSRPGGTAIFEIAAWGLPAILIPIQNSAQDHQRKNAYAYASTGAAIVIEQQNLTSNILTFEIDKLISNPEKLETMKKKAQNFARIDAADKIANEIIELALEHAQ